ncbi:hypothetical protein [Cryobacterium sp. M25]|uniref:hypothetical protein n=2 Tax=unclassified Cryobacterium TaxID=2649013 RepID=UPI000CE3F5EA|nr:hypothetical protein [Cryobacterium sp. M25]
MNVVMSRSDRQSFGLAVEELPNAHLNSTHLCSSFLRVLPVTGVAISTLGAPFGTETVCASDVEGVFAFPMVVGTLDIGAVDLYSRRPRTLTGLEIATPRCWSGSPPGRCFGASCSSIR